VGESRLGYRPELDGLRAIAVISVLLCHLGTTTFAGGYVGVDVFFVLSGFLISRIIADELRGGTFSVMKFYERRIRRIVPALVFVCACCTVAALLILLPNELKSYAHSLAAAALSVSNIWFSHQASYFAPAAATQPLLHTWSLGIEEQFYVVFPVLFAAVFKFAPQWLPALIWSSLAASLALSISLTGSDPESSYFLIHSRAWELLIGSVIALGLVRPPEHAWQRESACAFGLLGIAAAVLIFNNKTSFPGYAALLPCVGAALIIWAGETTSSARVLGSRPLVFIGLISYSLYLWHWPLIVFAKLLLLKPLTPFQQLFLSGLAVGLSVLTWRFVEAPFRRRASSGFSRATVFAAGGIGVGTLAACAMAFIHFNGLPGRFSTDILSIAAAARDSSPMRRACHFDGSLDGDYDKSCVLGAAVEPSIIVYGDSHGAELSVALASLAKARGESVRQLTASGCPPALGFSYPDRPECSAYNEKILRRLVALPPKTIVIASNSVSWTDEHSDEYMRGLDEVLHALSSAGHRVIMLGLVPPHPIQLPVPASLARRAMFGKKPENYVFRPDMAKIRSLDSTLERMATSEGVRYVSLLPMLCDRDRCKADIAGAVLYFDDNHMSVAGETLIATDLLAPLLWPDPVAAAPANEPERVELQ
jgi:peptidoglycan/LPS O-acetylase OafA/YrhL